MGFHKQAPREHSPPERSRAAPERTSRQEASALELEFEKKRLQLVRIDQEEFRFFHDKYHDRIFRFVYLQVLDHDRAGDLTLRIFARAWRKIGSFTWQGYSFGAWLFQIARNEVRQEFRSRRRRERYETPYDPQVHDVAEAGTPEGDILQEERKEFVRRCMARLPLERRQIFILHYWMDMTVREVALVMKLPLGTVASHLVRGRNALERIMREEERSAGRGFPEAVALKWLERDEFEVWPK